MKKNQKGITLIALIITIIVMLILVAVTINVALNGGIFDRAKNASTKSQKEADREELLSVVVGAYNAVEGTINETELRKLESDGWTIVKNADGTYTCTSPKKNVFTVDSNGSISDTKSITLDKTSITLEEVEDEEQLTATLIGLEGSITWESSKEGVATVTGSGKNVTVTAVANGNATITATCSGKQATCEVTVGGTPPSDISEIIGMYYSAEGNSAYNMEITASNISAFGSTMNYTYSNGIITIPNFMNTGNNLEISFTNSIGYKVLFAESELMNGGYLWATDISSLSTGSLSGKYINGSNYMDFKNATTCGRSKVGEEEDEKIRTYTYFIDYNLIILEEDDSYKLGENGTLINMRNGEVWSKSN